VRSIIQTTENMTVEEIYAGRENVEAEPVIPSDEKLKLICDAADEMKANKITVLDVRGQTIVADYFIVCSGTSITHIQSIGEGVRDRLRDESRQRAKPEGDAGSYWVILDYSDVIMHIFDEETREFYDLERLWADAKVSHYENGVFTEAPETSAENAEENVSDEHSSQNGE